MHFKYIGPGNAALKLLSYNLIELMDKQTDYKLAEGIKLAIKETEKMSTVTLFRLTPIDIQAIREDLLLTQEQFAKFMKVSRSTVESWERGDRKPEGKNSKKLALLLFLTDEEKAEVRRLPKFLHDNSLKYFVRNIQLGVKESRKKNMSKRLRPNRNIEKIKRRRINGH